MADDRTHTLINSDGKRMHLDSRSFTSPVIVIDEGDPGDDYKIYKLTPDHAEKIRDWLTDHFPVDNG